jgi:hypothetical protein
VAERLLASASRSRVAAAQARAPPRWPLAVFQVLFDVLFKGGAAVRRYAAIFAVAVAVLAVAPAAIGDRPLRQGLPNEPFTVDASVCGFAVDVTFPKQNTFITTFKNGKTIITGMLFATLTNEDSGKSITINVSGPGMIATEQAGITTFTLSGRSLLAFLAGQVPGQPAMLILTSGPVTLTFDQNGNIVSLDRTSANVEDLCPVLADP